MASVYLARHEAVAGAARLVALKIVAGLGNARFQREASVALRLEHPNIVRTYDVGQHGGRAYIAMELVWGVDLSKLPRPLPPPIARRIGADVARALHFAHELHGLDGRPLQMVHQDVSPQNVMVTYDGSVRLLDFGVARLGVVDRSRTNTVAGKPAYLAPEQLEGAGLDRRVDVFALGVVLHELVSGARLFARGSVAETYRAVLFEPIPDVRTLPGGEALPGDVATVLQQALYRDPSQRFASAASLRAAWEEAWETGGVKAATDAELAAFARAARPPKQTPAEMEQSLVASVPTHDGLAVALAPRRSPVSPVSPASQEPTLSEEVVLPTTGPAGRRTVVAALGVALVALLLVGVPAALRLGRRPAPVAMPNVDPGLVDAAIAESVADALDAAPRAQAPAPADDALDAGALASKPPPSRAGHPLHGAVPTGPSSVVAVGSASAAVAAVAPGVLRVTSTPWGKVSIDGKVVGDSPQSQSVSAGAHVVSIRTDSGEQSRNVTVVSGETALVKFVF
jgi:serine/threonine-protein kinase